MEQAFVVGSLVALVALASWLGHRSRLYDWNPVRMAFTSTAFSLLFAVSGSIGLRLSKPPRFVEGATWDERLIWSQIALGLALVPIAVFFWRQAARDVGRRVGRA